MKKNSKNILLINLCLLCVFFFTACNGSKDNKKEIIFLRAPTGLSIKREANAIIWDAVEDAKGYTVKINETEYKADYPFFSLDNISIDGACSIRVRAKSYKSGKKNYIKSDYCREIICTEADAKPLSFFDIYRIDRNATKEMTISYLEDIINSANSSAEAIETACNERMRLIISLEKELIVEMLIKAHGFEDCVATFSNKKINVIVKKPDLSESEYLIIFDIILAEMDISLNNVTIIPIA